MDAGRGVDSVNKPPTEPLSLSGRRYRTDALVRHSSGREGSSQPRIKPVGSVAPVFSKGDTQTAFEMETSIVPSVVVLITVN